MILTGADGLLKYGDSACVKVRNWSLNISRDAIDVSCLNTYDREYVAGLRSATGSATLYYDPPKPPTAHYSTAFLPTTLTAVERPASKPSASF